MKYNFFSPVIPIAALLLSCGNNKQADESTKDTLAAAKDTVAAPVPAPAPAAVDTAATIADYEAKYAKTKSVNPKPEYKEKNKKHVAAYTEPVLESKAPANEIIDPAGYNYKADKNATYPGGKKAFDAYFYKNFEYPVTALDHGIEGTIYAEIFINEKGHVEKVDFPGRKLGYGLEEEARRVIMATTQLDPAIKNGVPAKERYVLPIRLLIKE